MELTGMPPAAFVTVPSAAQLGGGGALLPKSAAGMGAGRLPRPAAPGLVQPPARGSALPGAAAAAALAAACRRRARRARAVPRPALAEAPAAAKTQTAQEAPVAAPAPEAPEVAPGAPEVAPEVPAEGKKKGGWGLFRGRRSLEERLLDDLSDERQSTRRVRAEREIQEAENTARIGELTTRVEKATEREAKLRARLKDVRQRKEEMDRETSMLAFEGEKWAPVLREQNAAIRDVVEVAERLQREEAELTAQLAAYDESNEKISKDMQTAEGMVAGYFTKED